MTRSGLVRHVSTSTSSTFHKKAPMEPEKTSSTHTNPFVSMGYPEPFTFDSFDYSARDIKKIVSSIREENTQDSDVDFSYTSPDDNPDLPKTSFLNSYRMTKASDFTWALRQKLLPSISDDEAALKRLEYLENAIHIINDHQRPIISVDVKIVNATFREVGFAIYDPKDNLNSFIPDIKRVHVIAQEYFGMLSTNTFHGRSYLMPQKEMIKFTRSIFKKYFAEDLPQLETPIIAGFDLPMKYATLQQTSPLAPTDVSSLLDVYYLYITPSLFRHDSLLNRFMSTTTLEIVLERLGVPYSELSNVGNRAYFALICLLKTMNPYERIRLGLDNPKDTVKFHEERMVRSVLNMRRTLGAGDSNTGMNRPLSRIIQVHDYEEGLKVLFE